LLLLEPLDPLEEAEEEDAEEETEESSSSSRKRWDDAEADRERDLDREKVRRKIALAWGEMDLVLGLVLISSDTFDGVAGRLELLITLRLDFEDLDFDETDADPPSEADWLRPTEDGALLVPSLTLLLRLIRLLLWLVERKLSLALFPIVLSDCFRNGI